MGWVSKEILDILSFLLPGFITAYVFYSLTTYPKPGPFDRVVQALIFTVVGKALSDAILLYANVASDDASTKDWELIASVLVAIFLGLAISYLLNRDTLHSLLRWLGITRETSFSSQWYSTFSHHCDCYVTLHLKGHRRLYGWPAEWPSRPGEGHFQIIDASWLDDNHETPATGVSAVLIPADQIEMVEFVKATDQKTGE